MNEIIGSYLARLGKEFRKAHRGTTSLEQLHKWGETIGYWLASDVIDGRVSEYEEGHDLLTNATLMTHELHDAAARNYFMEHPKELEHYAKMLLGEKEPDFSFGPADRRCY